MNDPDILEREDCRFLTSRWGEELDLTEGTPGGPITDAERDIIARLTDYLPGDEISFIAVRDGKPGILFEVEYDDGCGPSERDELARAKAQTENWHAQYYFSQQDDNYFGRAVIRAFVSEETLRKATEPEAILRAVSDSMLPIME